MAFELGSLVAFPFKTFTAFVRSEAFNRFSFPAVSTAAAGAAAFCLFQSDTGFALLAKVLFGASLFAGFGGLMRSFFNAFSFVGEADDFRDASAFGFRAAGFPFFMSLTHLLLSFPLTFVASDFAEAFLFASLAFAVFGVFFFAFFTGRALPFHFGSQNRASSVLAHPTVPNAKGATTQARA